MGPGIWEYILRLMLSALFGGVIGLEREIRLKGAGIRTHLIVCFASCMMMLVSKYGFFDMLSYEGVGVDPGRIAAGIVTAIGFLGAGTIFSRTQGVTGLTTAAGLWATVGVGMSAGAGLYAVSFLGTVIILTAELILYRDHPILGRPTAVLYIEMDDQPDVMERLQRSLARLELVPTSSRYNRGGGILSAELYIDHLPCPNEELGSLMARLMQEPTIRSVRW